MSFTRAFATTMQVEGGHAIVDGHETYMGIDRIKHSRWPGWQIIDECFAHSEPLSIAPGLSDMVRQFYLQEFWNPLRCDRIDPVNEAVAEELFEASVNCGPGNGIKFLQRALNALNSRERLYMDLYVDGSMGSKTLAATMTCLKHRPPRILVKCQNGEQYIHYKNWSKHEDFPGVFERT
ncbi:MAG: glycosyl hydrolase 108 family protein [Desulfobulbus sp.]